MRCYATMACQLQEEEARLKPGTVKEAAFRVMKARGTQPTTVEDVIRVSTIDGTRTDWQDKTKRTLNTASSCMESVAQGALTAMLHLATVALPAPAAFELAAQP